MHLLPAHSTRVNIRKILMGFVVLANSHCTSSRADEAGSAYGKAKEEPIAFGIGRPATPSEIDSMDVDVRPDGAGLPAGSGDVALGKTVYLAKCATCHGPSGYDGPYDKLATKPSENDRQKTIGNYWPYATTVFDYIQRAMPYDRPGSLSNVEVYAVTAYVLSLNNLLDSAFVADARSLPNVEMPARTRFVLDNSKGGKEVL